VLLQGLIIDVPLPLSCPDCCVMQVWRLKFQALSLHLTSG
jgi:hypothetical protein